MPKEMNVEGRIAEALITMVNSREFGSWVRDEVRSMENCPDITGGSRSFTVGRYIITVGIDTEEEE